MQNDGDSTDDFALSNNVQIDQIDVELHRNLNGKLGIKFDNGTSNKKETTVSELSSPLLCTPRMAMA